MTRYRLVRYEVEVEREVTWTDPRARSVNGQTVDGSGMVRDLALSLIPDDDREHFVVLLLSSQNKVLGFYQAAVGSGTTVAVQPSEVMRVSLLSGAKRLVVAHNHPAGSTKPSDEDIRLTVRLSKAARLLGMQLLDHVIVSHERPDWCWSAAEVLRLPGRASRPKAHEAELCPMGYRLTTSQKA